MKALLMTLALLLSSSSWASHFITCDVQAQVTGVTNMARMDGQATFRQGMDDYEQVVSIQARKVTNEGSTGCFPVGSQFKLQVRKDQIGMFKGGQTLHLNYRNVGDSLGSRISWLLRK